MTSIYRKYRDAGLCGKCGNEPVEGHTRCRPCLLADREISLRYVAKVKNAAFDAYGNACVCCGEDIEAFLSLDHINNDGNIFRASGYQLIWVWAKKNDYPNTLQLLCRNCNWGKYSNGGVCPHAEIS